ncbi:unnamed protein product [marine sediment metagenome]|uniref:EF-hand domain-containing protein n=1 Tax=marine sediment metagenome TaxID=412755 RepID=X1RM82_9ZZZZ
MSKKKLILILLCGVVTGSIASASSVIVTFHGIEYCAPFGYGPPPGMMILNYKPNTYYFWETASCEDGRGWCAYYYIDWFDREHVAVVLNRSDYHFFFGQEDVGAMYFPNRLDCEYFDFGHGGHDGFATVVVMMADFSGDGVVNLVDFSIFVDETCPHTLDRW